MYTRIAYASLSHVFLPGKIYPELCTGFSEPTNPHLHLSYLACSFA